MCRSATRKQRPRPGGKAVAVGAFLIALVVAAGVPAIGGVTAYSLSRVERHLPNNTPADFGLAFEDATFPSQVDGLRLRGWFMPAQPQEAARTAILLHGQHGNRGDAEIGFLPLAAQLVRDGYNVFTFDLRGHGESEGSHRSFGLLERRDLSGAIDYLQGRGQAGSGSGSSASRWGPLPP